MARRALGFGVSTTVALLLVLCGCASLRPPASGVAERASAAWSYSGKLRVSVKGPGLRGRTAVLLGFRRPGALRVEVPGPAGARLLLVVHGGVATAVFPSEKAVFQSAATAADLRALLGLALAPADIMDLLVGVPPPSVTRSRFDWGRDVPRSIEARLSDGTVLQVTVDDAELAAALPDRVFEVPPHAGYRTLDADEARRLWLGR